MQEKRFTRRAVLVAGGALATLGAAAPRLLSGASKRDSSPASEKIDAKTVFEPAARSRAARVGPLADLHLRPASPRTRFGPFGG